MLGQIEQLQPSSRPARYAAALAAVRQSLDDRTAQPNRIVYIISDLRQRDFAPQSLALEGDRRATSARESTPGTVRDNEDSIAVLRELAEDAAGCFLVDFGSIRHKWENLFGQNFVRVNSKFAELFGEGVYESFCSFLQLEVLADFWTAQLESFDVAFAIKRHARLPYAEQDPDPTASYFALLVESHI